MKSSRKGILGIQTVTGGKSVLTVFLENQVGPEHMLLLIDYPFKELKINTKNSIPLYACLPGDFWQARYPLKLIKCLYIDLKKKCWSCFFFRLDWRYAVCPHTCTPFPPYRPEGGIIWKSCRPGNPGVHQNWRTVNHQWSLELRHDIHRIQAQK